MNRTWKSASSIVLGVGSVALAVLLVLLLLKLTKVDLRSTIHLLATVKPFWFSAVIALTGINSWLAAEKWRIANTAAGDGRPSMWASFALTAIGGGLGHVLPAQMATALARAAGARALGGGTMLSAGATTIFEQIFDFLVFLCFAFVSVSTLALGGRAGLWSALVLIVLPACWLAAGHGANRIAAGVTWLIRRVPSPIPLDRFAAGFAAVGQAEPRLVRLLFLISVVRFAILVALCSAMTTAVGLQVSPWQLAAAVPFAVIAMGLAVTPAGLGATEWAMAGALIAFGVATHTAVQWVVLSRVLSTVAAVILGAVGGLMATWLWHGRGQARKKVESGVRAGVRS